MTTSRRAFLIDMAIPAGGLNPHATRYLSRLARADARSWDEVFRLNRAIDAGMTCGFLWAMTGLLCGVLLAVVGHHYILAAVVALGPFLSLHALWHYYMRG